MANTGAEVILSMLFLTFSGANVQFLKRKLTWRSYTIAKDLPTTKWLELIDQKKFAKATLNENYKTFVMYVAVLEAPIVGMTIYSLRATQITDNKPM